MTRALYHLFLQREKSHWLNSLWVFSYLQSFPSKGTTTYVAHKREQVSLQKSESESDCVCVRVVSPWAASWSQYERIQFVTGVSGFINALFTRTGARTTRCSGSHINIRSHSLSKERLHAVYYVFLPTKRNLIDSSFRRYYSYYSIWQHST